MHASIAVQVSGRNSPAIDAGTPYLLPITSFDFDVHGVLYCLCQVAKCSTYLPYDSFVNTANSFLCRMRTNPPRLALLLLIAALLAACEPSPTMHVIGYMIEERLGGPVEPPLSIQKGSLSGQVLFAGEPVPGAVVLVATRTGTPFSARTDNSGHYRIDNIPPGQYVPASIAPTFAETALSGAFGLPYSVTVRPGETARAPALTLQKHRPRPLPAPLPEAADLWVSEPVTKTAPFPAGAVAWERSIAFTRAGARIISLRLYRPFPDSGEKLPLLFGLFPGWVDDWAPVNVALADAGYSVLALSPSGVWGLDVGAHAEDARVALALARGGHLGVDLADAPAVALGGSFSSAIVNRLLRDERDQFAAWLTLGGISNAFSGSADFYAHRLTLPDRFRYVIPALGPANVYPLPFLYYSPVYTASQLPPTMIIHTDVDRIIPISQAYELEEALRAAGVYVEVLYYEDVSHYLQIGDDMTESGQEMFWQVLKFLESQTAKTEDGE